MKKNELNYKDLKSYCNPNMFKFETTFELDDSDLAFGQERGIKALEFGLAVDSKGYNLFIEGPSGVGKTLYTKKHVAKVAEKKKIPDDWCYIYNFSDPNEPVAVSLPAGSGKAFRDTMDAFISDIRKDIKLTFNNEDFEKEKNLIRQKYDEQKNKILEKLNSQSMKYGFQVKTTQNGIYMMPVIDGKTIEEEEFEKLDETVKQAFEEKSSIVQDQIFEVIRTNKIY